MNRARQPADHWAREQALDPARSFAVTAPAGSGKTALLTHRVLKLLACCDHPEEVICITFTRKAAAEMQERITQTIWDAYHCPRPDDPHKQLGWDLAQAVLHRSESQQWQLLENPNRLRIQTIDGLCRALTQQNPLASQIGGQAQLLDQPQLAYREAVSSTLTALESDELLAPHLEQLLSHLDNNLDSISELLTQLLARRDQWMGHLLGVRDARLYLESVLSELNKQTLCEAQDLLAPWASDLCLLADYAGNNCLSDSPQSSLCSLAGLCELPDTNATQLPVWRSLVELMLTQTGEWRSERGLNVRFGFPAGKSKEEKAQCKARKAAMGTLISQLAEQPKLLSQLRLIRYLPPAFYEQDQWGLLNSLTHILPRLVAELRWVFKQLNATDFIELTQAALTAFGAEDEPTELALALDYKIRHILVDEFQDTATPQLRLLESLTRGWQPEDGRTLFIVGDGMQSCYGFRDANVGIFLDVRTRGIGDIVLEPLDLQVNFRSQGGVIQWVNQTFKSAFPDSDDIARGAVRYSDAIAYHSALSVPASEIHLMVDQADRQAEAMTVCQLIAEAKQEDPAGRIAVLVRNRSQLQDILPAMRKEGFVWQATDIEPLDTRMAIIDLLSLTKALLDPSDRVAWLSFLRSPLCGLELADLHAFAGLKVDDEHAEFPLLLESLLQYPDHVRLSVAGKAIIDRVSQVIRVSWLHRRRKSLRDWLYGIWLALGGPATLLENADRQNCETYFTLLEKHDQGGQIPDWTAFKQAVTQLYAAPDPQADGKLHVMTIHKSKGLEFETVIIPGLDKSGRADSNELLLWQERIDQKGGKELIMGTLSPTGQDTDPIYHYLREEKSLRVAFEATRLLYVGCTRAINKLHLLANIRADSKDGSLQPPAKNSLLSTIWLGLDIEQARVVRDQDNHVAEPLPPFPYTLRLHSQWQRPYLVPSTLLTSYRGREFSDKENLPEINKLDPQLLSNIDEQNLPDLESFGNRVARHTGTLLHRILEQICLSGGPSQWDNTRISQQLPFWKAQLKMQGILGVGLQQALNSIELGVRKTLSDAVGCWLLDPSHQHSACELELHHGQRQLHAAIIDRTFIEDGIRWVIDYKSSTPAPSQTLDDFLAAEMEAYRPQLHRYAQLFAQQSDTPVRTALYFPLLQHFQEVSLEQL